jgi:hypothetical protein
LACLPHAVTLSHLLGEGCEGEKGNHVTEESWESLRAILVHTLASSFELIFCLPPPLFFLQARKIGDQRVRLKGGVEHVWRMYRAIGSMSSITPPKMKALSTYMHLLLTNRKIFFFLTLLKLCQE